MSARLNRNVSKLKKFKKIRKQKECIQTADDDFIACLIECIYNIDKGRVPLTPEETKKLKRHIKTINRLARQRDIKNARQMLVSQKGGFFGSILAPILASIATGLISKAIK